MKENWEGEKDKVQDHHMGGSGGGAAVDEGHMVEDQLVKQQWMKEHIVKDQSIC